MFNFTLTPTTVKPHVLLLSISRNIHAVMGPTSQARQAYFPAAMVAAIVAAMATVAIPGPVRPDGDPQAFSRSLPLRTKGGDKQRRHLFTGESSASAHFSANSPSHSPTATVSDDGKRQNVKFVACRGTAQSHWNQSLANSCFKSLPEKKSPTPL